MDLLIVAPGNNRVIYQKLAKEYAAIEPPIWSGLLAQFVRNKGYETQLIDQEAEGLGSDEIAQRGAELNPRLVVILAYGQQPSASTQNMTVAIEICSKFREFAPKTKTLLIGTHPSALPSETLDECEVDFICQGEGPYTLEALLQIKDMDSESSLSQVPGLWYRKNGVNTFTKPAPLISEKDLSTTLPGIAWDMLPMKSYRAHNWHCFDHINERSPYASIYTGLGCPYKCSFCCINAPFGKPNLRLWSPECIIGQLDILATRYGVVNIKIADEMFVLNENHVIEICDLIIERGYKFNIWAYARVDTVKEKFLDKLKKAGFNWLCLGIESNSKHVRDGAQKGHYSENDIFNVVRRIQDAGIYINANYIFGLPDDTLNSMQENLQLAMELNCEWANFYSVMAYPGSPLYQIASDKGWQLPAKWQDFSQHSYEQLPLPTEHLSAGEVLGFRDKAWQTYFTNAKYLDMIKAKFGQEVHDHIVTLATFKLERKYAA